MQLSPPSRTAADTVNKLMLRAESFFERHHQDPAIRPTFGNFAGPPLAPLNRKRLRVLVEAVENLALKKKHPLRILDLGCGGGLATCALAALGHSALGMDRNPEEIRLARLFTTEEKLEGLFLESNLVQDPDWEKSAEQSLGGKPEVVVLAHSLSQLDSTLEFLPRLGRWLDSGTQLVINEPNPMSPLFRIQLEISALIPNPGLAGASRDAQYRTFESWTDVLHASGFRIVENSLQAVDPVPLLNRVKPERCWSLVFQAWRS